MFGDDMCPFNLKCTFKVFINVKCGSSFEKIPVLRRCQKDIDLIKVMDMRVNGIVLMDKCADHLIRIRKTRFHHPMVFADDLHRILQYGYIHYFGILYYHFGTVCVNIQV